MMSEETARCPHVEQIPLFAAQALPRSEASLLREHLAACRECSEELETLQPVIASFASWPTDVLRPSASLWRRLAQRITRHPQEDAAAPSDTASSTDPEWTDSEPDPEWTGPDWEDVAPGIACKLLATDSEHDRVSMLVRLAPGGEYPPHSHAGVEELHLLEGELWIDGRKLHPGDYNRGEPGTADRRVWSETGCTCVLMTSTLDVLR